MTKKLTEDEQRAIELDKIIEETTVHVESNLDDRDAVMQQIRQRGVHAWRQEGIELICTICPNRHGFYIKPDYILKGTDEKGMPILDKVVIK